MELILTSSINQAFSYLLSDIYLGRGVLFIVYINIILILRNFRGQTLASIFSNIV